MDRLPDPAPQELIDRLQTIAHPMPRLTRAIFLAHRLDGLPYEEIARRTGLTVHQVERHIARAILFLDRGLHEQPRPRCRFW